MKETIAVYLSAIEKELTLGNDTEQTHRPALKALVDSLKVGITATNEPRAVECGAPDFVVSKNTRHGPLTIGHIETKNVGVSLAEAERSEQLKRYRAALPNLVLTDYLEFRWYLNRETCRTARLAYPGPSGKLTYLPEDEVVELLTDFFAQEPERITKAQFLAERLARLTHIIRDIIVTSFKRGHASTILTGLRETFAKTLIPDLNQPEKLGDFADMYAQTMTYGLFAARCNHPDAKGPFQRLGAASEIPKTNPFLRSLFNTITGPELDDEPYANIVSSVVQLLANADLDAILEDFGKRGPRRDPVVHFYETFLAAYDPKLRKARGVYYTPEPVVSYIVRSVDYLLKTRFDCPSGLADTSEIKYPRAEDGSVTRPRKTNPRVLILDPACGTGTFLYAVIDHIREEFMEKKDAGLWSGYVREHLLPRLFGFELLMAPYAVAHLKLGMALAGLDLPTLHRKNWVYDFKGDERLGVYLTNTLEEAEKKAEGLFPGLNIIAEEANAASAIKRDLPIMVVMGNPPYSGHSANRSWEEKDGCRVPTFIGRMVRDYYEVDGKPLGEKNPKWLQDDYVKFIRFAQWRIERSGYGILAFITNHAYLDNPTFRGMRQRLMSTFDEMYVLDLHGSTKKGERSPDGSKDTNVFDIMPGVAIGIFARHGMKKHRRICHADCYGTRLRKYDWLGKHYTRTTEWARIEPAPPLYMFKPQDTRLLVEYQSGHKLSDIFSQSSVGIVTAQDAATIGYSESEAQAMAGGFSLPAACVKPILYRPFDRRFVVYDKRAVTRPRMEIMQHMLAGRNLGLVAPRRMETAGAWSHAFPAVEIVEHVAVSLKTIDTLFPLYLFPMDRKNGNQKELGGIHANLATTFAEEMEKHLGMKLVAEGHGDQNRTFGPEDVLHYIYAVLYSPKYRSRYGEFLKVDFPRIPLTSDKKLFVKLCKLGSVLVGLHLMQKFGPEMVSYPVKGDNIVEKVQYEKAGRRQASESGQPKGKGLVWINGLQYFAGVPEQVWEFRVGGYQVCEKWLKDRKGRVLSFDDLRHYGRIVSALHETVRLMGEIDSAIRRWPIR